MTKDQEIVKELNKEIKKNKKEANAMNKKAIVETIKTIVITALITGIIAFASGVMYQKQVSDDTTKKVNEAVSSVKQLKQ